MRFRLLQGSYLNISIFGTLFHNWNNFLLGIFQKEYILKDASLEVMIEPKYHSNLELADAFRRLAAQIYKDRDNYRIALRKADLVRESDLRFPEFYQVNGTLQGITIEHIGTVTLGLLEELLERGEDEVIRDQVALQARQDIRS